MINRKEPEPQFVISVQAPAPGGNQFRLRLQDTGKKIRHIEGNMKCLHLKSDLDRDFAAAVSLSEPPPLLGFSWGVQAIL